MTRTNTIRAASVAELLAQLEAAKRDGWTCVDVVATIQREDGEQPYLRPGVVPGSGGAHGGRPMGT